MASHPTRRQVTFAVDQDSETSLTDDPGCSADSSDLPSASSLPHASTLPIRSMPLSGTSLLDSSGSGESTPQFNSLTSLTSVESMSTALTPEGGSSFDSAASWAAAIDKIDSKSKGGSKPKDKSKKGKRVRRRASEVKRSSGSSSKRRLVKVRSRKSHTSPTSAYLSSGGFPEVDSMKDNLQLAEDYLCNPFPDHEMVHKWVVLDVHSEQKSEAFLSPVLRQTGGSELLFLTLRDNLKLLPPPLSTDSFVSQTKVTAEVFKRQSSTTTCLILLQTSDLLLLLSHCGSKAPIALRSSLRMATSKVKEYFALSIPVGAVAAFAEHKWSAESIRADTRAFLAAYRRDGKYLEQHRDRVERVQHERSTRKAAEKRRRLISKSKQHSQAATESSASHLSLSAATGRHGRSQTTDGYYHYADRWTLNTADSTLKAVCNEILTGKRPRHKWKKGRAKAKLKTAAIDSAEKRKRKTRTTSKSVSLSTGPSASAVALTTALLSSKSFCKTPAIVSSTAIRTAARRMETSGSTAESGSKRTRASDSGTKTGSKPETYNWAIFNFAPLSATEKALVIEFKGGGGVRPLAKVLSRIRQHRFCLLNFTYGTRVKRRQILLIIWNPPSVVSRKTLRISKSSSARKGAISGNELTNRLLCRERIREFVNASKVLTVASKSKLNWSMIASTLQRDGLLSEILIRVMIPAQYSVGLTTPRRLATDEMDSTKSVSSASSLQSEGRGVVGVGLRTMVLVYAERDWNLLELRTELQKTHGVPLWQSERVTLITEDMKTPDSYSKFQSLSEAKKAGSTEEKDLSKADASASLSSLQLTHGSLIYVDSSVSVQDVDDIGDAMQEPVLSAAEILAKHLISRTKSKKKKTKSKAKATTEEDSVLPLSISEDVSGSVSAVVSETEQDSKATTEPMAFLKTSAIESKSADGGKDLEESSTLHSVVPPMLAVDVTDEALDSYEIDGVPKGMSTVIVHRSASYDEGFLKEQLPFPMRTPPPSTMTMTRAVTDISFQSRTPTHRRLGSTRSTGYRHKRRHSGFVHGTLVSPSRLKLDRLNMLSRLFELRGSVGKGNISSIGSQSVSEDYYASDIRPMAATRYSRSQSTEETHALTPARSAPPPKSRSKRTAQIVIDEKKSTDDTLDDAFTDAFTTDAKEDLTTEIKSAQVLDKAKAETETELSATTKKVEMDTMQAPVPSREISKSAPMPLAVLASTAPLPGATAPMPIGSAAIPIPMADVSSAEPKRRKKGRRAPSYLDQLVEESPEEFAAAIKEPSDDSLSLLLGGLTPEWRSAASSTSVLPLPELSSMPAMSAAERDNFELSDVFIVQEKVGVGKTAVVHKALYKDMATVALKEFRFARLTESIMNDFVKEVCVLKKLRHPNVALLLGSHVDMSSKELFLMLEWLPGGCLYDLLHCDIEIGFVDALTMCLDIARGMQYLHSQQIIHRDLKSHNLLLDEEYRVKVTDFGTAKHLDQLTLAMTELGTVGFMAPEVLEPPYSWKVDVWSFAVVIWEVYTRGKEDNVFTGFYLSKYVQRCRKGERPKLGEDCPADFRHLVDSCWAFDPKKRPDFTLIVQLLTQQLAAAEEAYSSSDEYTDSDDERMSQSDCESL